MILNSKESSSESVSYAPKSISIDWSSYNSTTISEIIGTSKISLIIIVI